MKRILALLLALTMLVGVMAGCSGAPEETKPQQTQAQAQGDAPATGKQLTGKVVYWSMYNEMEPEAKAIAKAAEMFKRDYPDCTVEIQWVGRSNQDLVGPALEGGEQLDILDNFNYSVSSSHYMDITDMMNEPALGQENMTVAESVLPVWIPPSTLVFRSLLGWLDSSTTRTCLLRLVSRLLPQTGLSSWLPAKS